MSDDKLLHPERYGGEIPRTADEFLDIIAALQRQLLTQAAELMGKKGGESRSEAKIKAARDNGKRGGRPVQ